ncbi:hypothetical protein TUM4438_07860 [Shewanella sairae]|uniref:Uncharacterized protein n=1 Tax=Shewanella sairae TaxID=190310 RepID=A0ABQ4P3I7_9GAMM|nr:hypothetical protein TUM4438_07860 [Shewanella sairae]
MYKSLLLLAVLAFSSQTVMASCTDIGPGGGGGAICCEVKDGVLECYDTIG